MPSDFSFAISMTAPSFCIIGLGVPFKQIGLLTEEFARVGSALVFNVTLSLALLCAGASIRLQEFQTSPALYGAVLGRLVVVALVLTRGGIACGLRGENLAVLYLMSASPAAAASYPMARAMKADHYLAAAMNAATSPGSLFSTTLGIFLLRTFRLIKSQRRPCSGWQLRCSVPAMLFE